MRLNPFLFACLGCLLCVQGATALDPTWLLYSDDSHLVIATNKGAPYQNLLGDTITSTAPIGLVYEYSGNLFARSNRTDYLPNAGDREQPGHVRQMQECRRGYADNNGVNYYGDGSGWGSFYAHEVGATYFLNARFTSMSYRVGASASNSLVGAYSTLTSSWVNVVVRTNYISTAPDGNQYYNSDIVTSTAARINYREHLRFTLRIPENH